MSKELTGYDYSRIFWDFSFENPDKIKPYHAAVFFFAVEHCNRLGWKKKFGLPTSMVMEATGIKSYTKYKQVFTELVDFGFLKVIEMSKNQYSSNVVALSCHDKALVKALDKALSKHSAKHESKQVQSTGQSTGQSTVSIDKQLTIEQRTIEQGTGILEKKIELSQIDIENTIEFVSITGGRTLTYEKILEYWKAYLIHADGTAHNSRKDKINHFRNWLKLQPHDRPKTTGNRNSTDLSLLGDNREPL